MDNFSGFDNREEFLTLQSDKISCETRSCDLCGAVEHHTYCHTEFLGSEFLFVKCSQCGLIYQNPMITKESRSYIYETLDYWSSLESGNDEMLNYCSYLGERTLRQKNARRRISWMRPSISPGCRILDLGCSDGLLVKELENAGYDAVGLDISSAMLNEGKRHFGVHLERADFEGSWPFEEASFDVITCFATLANVTFPSLFFDNVSRHLKPGGLFCFNFLDIDRLLCRMLGDRLYIYRPTVATIFSTHTLEKFLQESNMQMSELWTDIQYVPLDRMLGFFKMKTMLKILNNIQSKTINLKMPLFTGYEGYAIKSR